MDPLTLQLPSLDSSQETEPEVIDTTLGEGDSLGSPFLATIPEQDRAIVEKYIKGWDAGVTKKFQALHTQYEPYKNLGDLEEIQRNLEIIQILKEDPQLFYQNLAEILEMSNGETEMEFDPTQQQQQVDPNLDPRDAEISDLKAVVESLSGNMQQFQSEQQEKAQMAELDNYMKEMHTTHGDFDEDWVLLQISRGTDPAEAIKSWNTLITGAVSSQQKRPLPNIIPGGGTTPGGQVDPSKFSSSDRKKYVADMLSAANQ